MQFLILSLLSVYAIYQPCKPTTSLSEINAAYLNAPVIFNVSDQDKFAEVFSADG